jgi:hypothetical protein
LNPGLVGVPLLVSYEQKWVCGRLRYQVLLNALRLFRRDSPLLRKAGAGEIAALMQLSNGLDLRLVDAHGGSVARSAAVGPEGDAELARRLCAVWDDAHPGSSGQQGDDRTEWLRAAAGLAERDQLPLADLTTRLFGTPLSSDKQLKIGASYRYIRPVVVH